MGISKKLEKIFAAAAFAEAGEDKTAREILKEAETADRSARSYVDIQTDLIPEQE